MHLRHGKFLSYKLILPSDQFAQSFLYQKSVHAYQNLRHHERHVGACSFSRNGALLATGSNDRTVAIWKTGLGENISGNITFQDSNFTLQVSRSKWKKNSFLLGCRTLSEITEQSHRLTMIAVKNEAVLKQSIVSHTSDINHLVSYNKRSL